MYPLSAKEMSRNDNKTVKIEKTENDVFHLFSFHTVVDFHQNLADVMTINRWIKQRCILWWWTGANQM